MISLEWIKAIGLWYGGATLAALFWIWVLRNIGFLPKSNH